MEDFFPLILLLCIVALCFLISGIKRLVIATKETSPKTKALQNELTRLQNEAKQQMANAEKKEQQLQEKEKLLQIKQLEFKQIKEANEREYSQRKAEFKFELDALCENKLKFYPYLASAIADLETVHFSQIADHFEHKPNPAYTAAETVRKLREKTKSIIEEKKRLEYKIAEMTDAFGDWDAVRRIYELFGEKTIRAFYAQMPSGSFVRAFDNHFSLESPVSVTCRIYSHDSDRVHVTSLSSCSCESFRFAHKPCKHMIWLASQFCLLLLSNQQHEQIIREINTANINAQNIISQAKKEKKRLEDKEKIIKEQSLTYPWLADLLATYDDQIDELREKKLSTKAHKSVEIVRQIRSEKKMVELERNLLRNQLTVYVSLFPWLEEFKEVSVSDAYALASETSSDDDYFEKMRNWLSPDEYTRLSPEEKTELAFSRYQSRHKTDWEIGVEYERYIGYLYEKNGYNVTYFGATMGLSDMGRDLLCEKDGEVLVIQCKRWASEKTIHEKHIFQLFGTSFVLHLETPAKHHIPVFYTTASLSDTARKCASGLDMKVFEQYPMEQYPEIKCNINYDTEGRQTRIYHLPFDQQYDHIKIEPSKGEFYAFTIKEAEAAGFRHANKHIFHSKK